MIYLIVVFLISFSLSEAKDAIVLDHLKYIAAHHYHGYAHDHLTYEDAKELMQHEKLEMSCGYISLFTIEYLREQGIEARFVLTLTLDEWNDFNNGHSMVEVYENGRWFLWDMSLKNYFVMHGHQLSARQFCKFASNDSCKFVRFCDEPILSPSIVEQLNILGMDFVSASGQRAFYRRISQVLFIMKGQTLYFTCNPAVKERVLTYPFSCPLIYLTKEEFRKEFYKDATKDWEEQKSHRREHKRNGRSWASAETSSCRSVESGSQVWR